MAIMLVNASASTGSALPAGLSATTNGNDINFGNLLSLQISGGSTLNSLVLETGGNEFQKAESDFDPNAALTSGELLAGMLAVTPGNTTLPEISTRSATSDVQSVRTDPLNTLLANTVQPDLKPIDATISSTSLTENSVFMDTLIARNSPQIGSEQINAQISSNLQTATSASAATLATKAEAADLSAQILAIIPDSIGRMSQQDGSASLADVRLSGLIPQNTAQNQNALQSLNAGSQTPTSVLATSTDAAAIIAAPAKSQAETTSADFAGSLNAQASLQSIAPHPQQKTSEAAISTPIQDARWTQDFSERIVWLAKNDQQSAQLNINPPQLGPVQINLQINGDQATATFASPHAEVRLAIENSLPRLREMLNGAGIELGQTNVGSQMAQQQDRGNQAQTPDIPRFSNDKAILRENAGRAGGITAATGRSGRGLVDLFA